MAKVTLSTITSGFASVAALNANFAAIAAALENTLSRDGTAPNTLSADFDCNNNAILNCSEITVNGSSVAALAAAAAASAAAAATSETNAATSETNAASSASSASTSASSASTSATAASTSASSASTSASAAATSASNAATSETNAASSASSASTSASNAATSETNAASSASAAATSASNAATSETNAAASYDAFDDRYLGDKASDPTLDNDGNALLTGALYFNTVSNEMRVYSGSAWLVAYVPSTGLSDHLSDPTAAHAASAISYNGSTNLVATDVEAALDELDTEKLALAGGTMSGNIAMGNNNVSGAKTVGFNAEYDNGNSGTAATITMTNGQKQKITLTGNATLTVSFTSAPVGNYVLRLIQDGTGSRTVTWSGLSATRWLGATSAPAINSTASSETIVSIYYDGTNAVQTLSKVGAV